MKRPYITLSYAQSVDGRIATASGNSQWISGESTLQFSQELRRDNDGILVGIGTVLADNPRLTCRIEPFNHPIRFILDRRFQTPPSYNICSNESKTVIFGEDRFLEDNKAQILKETGVELIGMDFSKDQALHEIVGIMKSDYHVSTLYVEGGGGVLTSFFKAELVDQALIVIAPMIIGKGIEAIGDLGINELEHAIRPKRSRFYPIGRDMIAELIFRESDKF